METKTSVIGPIDQRTWCTMLLLKQGLEYMVNSGKPKFKKEIEKDKSLYKGYLSKYVA